MIHIVLIPFYIAGAIILLALTTLLVVGLVVSAQSLSDKFVDKGE